MTQRGRGGFSRVARRASGRASRASLAGTWPEPLGRVSGLLRCSPRPVRSKSAGSQSRDAARGEPALSSLRLTSLPGLTAPLLLAAFSEHLSICMKRKSNA